MGFLLPSVPNQTLCDLIMLLAAAQETSNESSYCISWILLCYCYTQPQWTCGFYFFGRAFFLPSPQPSQIILRKGQFYWSPTVYIPNVLPSHLQHRFNISWNKGQRRKRTTQRAGRWGRRRETTQKLHYKHRTPTLTHLSNVNCSALQDKEAFVID